MKNNIMDIDISNITDEERFELNQSHMNYNYGNKITPLFNEALFDKSTEKIVDAVKAVILSCQKFSGYYRIIVDDFTLIDDYARMQEILGDHEDTIKANKKKKRLNQYRYINLKGSDAVLLVVHYYIQVKKQFERIKVYVLIPRIIDNFYFRLNGNLYAAQNQIVEGSTYNNTKNNSKRQCITLRTSSNVVMQIYKNDLVATDMIGREVPMCNYSLYVFGKAAPAYRYIFAKYGFYQTLKLCRADFVYLVDDVSKVEDTDNHYIFQVKKDEIYVVVPIYMYDNDMTLQSLIYTIMTTSYKDTTLNDIVTPEFWIASIGKNYNTDKVLEKGMALCTSLESLYDYATKTSIMLPEHLKENVYQIILWMMREYSELRQKDNMDMASKRIRFEEYIATLYGSKLTTNIWRLSDAGSRVTIDKIKKTILIRPTMLIENITKCNLANYRDMVNDLDSMVATKFTFKSARIGKGSASKSSIYKDIHPSQIGRIDLDSSSKSDPGATGVLCPAVELFGPNNDRFSDYKEPNTWDEAYDTIYENYRKIVGKKEAIEAKMQLLGIQGLESKLDDIRENLIITAGLASPISRLNPKLGRYSLEEGGIISYE